VSNNKPFEISNLLRYKSHNTISITKHFIRNNVQQGECLTQDFDMTKHSDYFVWKDTSERVARRCDDTIDKKRVNSCVLKHLFLEGVEQPKYRQKNPGMLSPTRYECHVFKISRLTPPKRINSNEFGAKDSEKLFSSLIEVFDVSFNSLRWHLIHGDQNPFATWHCL